MLEPGIVELARAVRARVSAYVSGKNNWDIVPSTMQGACGIASYILASVLFNRGVQCELVVGEFYFTSQHPYDEEAYSRPICGHCWVEIGQTRLDITASQFNVEWQADYPEVLVGDASDRALRERHRGLAAVKCLTDWQTQSPLHKEHWEELGKIITEFDQTPKTQLAA